MLASRGFLQRAFRASIETMFRSICRSCAAQPLGQARSLDEAYNGAGRLKVAGCRGGPHRQNMNIRIKRIYEAAADTDGLRVLVDRLWPRGIRKSDARLDFWARELAPSDALRKWFNHEPARWGEFKTRYFEELDSKPEAIEHLLGQLNRPVVTLIFATREPAFNNAAALKAYLANRLEL